MLDSGTSQLLARTAEQLTQRRVSLPVVGRSMRPLLSPGVRIDIQPLDSPLGPGPGPRPEPRPRLGAILVYAASDGIVVHRLMAILPQASPLRLVTKGDASAHCDPAIEPSRVLGEVVLVRYRRLSLRVDNRIARWLGWMLSSAAPHVHRLIERIRRRMPTLS